MIRIDWVRRKKSGYVAPVIERKRKKKYTDNKTTMANCDGKG